MPRSKNKKAATPSLAPLFHKKGEGQRRSLLPFEKILRQQPFEKKKFLKSLARQLGKVVLSQNVRTALGKEPRNALETLFFFFVKYPRAFIF